MIYNQYIFCTFSVHKIYMKTMGKRGLLITFLVLLPYYGKSAPILLDGLSSVIDIIAVLNTVLLFSSILSIIRFFWPGDRSHVLLHLLNSIFAVLFYAVSLTFLVTHKSYFEGYETLSNAECIRKYFLSTDFVSLIKKLIIVAFVLNIIYVVRHAKTFYLEN